AACAGSCPDVRLQVRLGDTELVEEPVLLDIDFVEVVVNKALKEPGPDIAHFQRRASIERTLPTCRVRLRVWHFEIWLEGVDLVGDQAGVGINRCVLKWWRAQP